MRSWLMGWRRRDQVAGLLGGIFLLLWAVQWIADGRFTVPRLSAPSVPAVHAEPPLESTAPIPVDDAVIAARPIFIATRRPYVPPAESAAPAAPVAPPEPMTLLATVMAEGRQVALIQSQRDNRIEKLGIGDAIAGWTLAEVHTGHVILERGTESRQLDLVVQPGVPARHPSRPTENEE